VTEKATTPWTDYLAAAHRLDTVRRDAAQAAAAEAEAVATACDEIPGIQARLATQAGRLRESALQAGASPPAVVPGEVEQRAAAQAVEGGPHAVLTALRQARSEVDVADSALARLNEPEAGQLMGNLLFYSGAGLAATVIQVLFALLAEPATRNVYAVACGLIMAGMLWAITAVLISILHPRRPRTARAGALATAAPVVLTALLFLILS
jgi:hypothetical protein